MSTHAIDRTARDLVANLRAFKMKGTTRKVPDIDVLISRVVDNYSGSPCHFVEHKACGDTLVAFEVADSRGRMPCFLIHPINGSLSCKISCFTKSRTPAPVQPSAVVQTGSSALPAIPVAHTPVIEGPPPHPAPTLSSSPSPVSAGASSDIVPSPQCPPDIYSDLDLEHIRPVAKPAGGQGTRDSPITVD